MRTQLLLILQKIFDDLDYNSSHSLFEGKSGILLFKLYYLKYIKQGDLSDIVVPIQDLSELPINYDEFPSFCGGQAGINWFFNFLSKHGYINKKDYKFFETADLMMAEASLNYLKFECYDYLHGAIGIAHHLLYTNNKAFKPYFKEFLDDIIALMREGPHVLYHFDFNLSTTDKNRVNPSLSHGMTSVLKFCMECYSKGVYKKKSEIISNYIVTFLLNNMNADHSYSYFPYFYDSANRDNRQSRLSWCYGDLTIAYILYQYAELFDDKIVETTALEILNHSAKRRSEQETGVVDAGFCHGTAGIAYIFGKLWYKTKHQIFYDANIYWLEKTIDYSVHKDGIAGYKKFDKIKNAWIIDAGLLEGAAGIGLSLISYLFEDYRWDYCFMLNDN